MRAHGWLRWATALLASVAVGVVVAAPAIASTPSGSAPRQVPDGEGFYTPQRLRSGRPGQVIWTTPIISPAGSRAWKVLYHSRAIDGRDIAVSGFVVAPVGKAPPGGRPVVSWAHGTHGLADACAPSKALDTTYRLPGIKDFIKAGDVVVATDYEGLGTPGEHPYLVGESEGRGVLDIVRAAQQLPQAGASANTLIYGHSQGGQAALFAGQIAPRYAPDLHVLGVTAVAPVTDVTAMLPAATKIPALLAYVVMAAVGYHAAYPQLDLSSVLTPATLANIGVVDQRCSDDLVDLYAQSSPSQVLTASPADVPGFAALLQQNTAGNVATSAPMLLIQGDRDLLVNKRITDAFAMHACAIGDRVLYHVYPGRDHVGARDASVKEVQAWMAARIAGQPAPTSC
jgi:alpha-beta hydrolase superfamily lysophospholipase